MNPVFILSIILLLLTTVQAAIYKKVGDTVVLSPGSVTPPITTITWNHNLDLAADWYGGKFVFYREFKGRCTLNTTTGELTISDVTLEDSGYYTAEINDRVLNTTEIKVLHEFPKPTISINCNDEKTQCVLTCETHMTYLGPVSYIWRLGDMMGWKRTKEVTITKWQTEPTLSCIVEHPGSSEISDPIYNPIISNP